MSNCDEDTDECTGCGVGVVSYELNTNGLCDSCEYENDANLDNLTDKE